MTSPHVPPAAIARIALVLMAALGFVLTDISTAMAQSRNCSQIVAILRGIERNEIFVSFNGIVGELQGRQAEVVQAEGLWMRNGCQQLVSAGQALSRECQSLARTITLGRSQVEQLTTMAREGQSLAQSRQQLLQDYARSGCDAGQSGVTIGQQGARGGLLDNMFGGGYDYVDTPYDPWSAQQTRRTVCVRTCDGFFWPISFSTTDGYVGQDAIQCHEMCPGTEVALFSYRNPGEEPEDMISLSGASYRSMPYAFRFRTEIDKSCSCRTQDTVGTIAMSGEGNTARAVIELGDLEFPLPRHDPRERVETVVAEAIYVPLPRPRPRADGTAEATVGQQPDLDSPDLRIVEFGDRRVRIVGPETPYVPAPAGES